MLAGCLPAPVPPALGGSTKVAVSAAFYPLEYLAERVGGSHVEVTGLTKPGAEPHETELTARDLGRLTYAHLVLYLSGFQPAVDEGVTQRAGDRAFDVSSAARTDRTDPEAPAATDPHFWLDPVRYAAVAAALGERLAVLDPPHAGDYRANAVAVVTDLTSLDTDFAAGLADCVSRTLVTGHAAFGYLAERYHLTQVAIAGFNPDAEPSARRLGEIADTVRATGVRTVYSETLADPKLAETLATTTGATLAVLDPVEGVTDASAGTDYLQIMRADLATLRAGQGCS
jgi:zinc transport system substrate-binding protein